MAVITVACVEWMHHCNRRNRPKKILAALEEFESMGDKVIHEDITIAAHKWTLLRLAYREPEKYKVAAHKERIATQLKALEPHSEQLEHQMKISAGVNLGGIVQQD